VVYGYPNPLDLGKEAHVRRDIRSYLEVKGMPLTLKARRTIVILEQGFRNANEPSFLERNAVVIWEYAVGRG